MAINTPSVSSEKVLLADALRAGSATQSFAKALCLPNQKRRQGMANTSIDMTSKYQPTRTQSSMVRIESNMEGPTNNTQHTAIISVTLNKRRETLQIHL